MADVARLFDVVADADATPLFNIAPTQTVTAVRAAAHGRRALCSLRWGLVPSWADDLSIGNRMINARAESVATKPAFRRAFKTRRCLIVADGFYEWQKIGRQKQPHYIRLKSDRPFGFAGLWETWTKGAAPVETCCIVTTDANELVAPIHDRMPVIVPPDAYECWLALDVEDVELLQPLLRPYPADEMTAYAVSTRVNNPAYDAADCIEPSSPQTLFG